MPELSFESEDLGLLFEEATPALLDAILGPAPDAAGEEESRSVEAEGTDPVATFADWLAELITLYRDYNFRVRSVQIVKALPHRVGAHVFGHYLSPDETRPFSFERDRLTLTEHHGLWRLRYATQ
jgi:SHS2 domain-containing protein